MKARIASWATPVVVFVLGCGETAKPPATDPESLRKLEELQKNAAQGEKSANPKKKAGR